jgi:hypothetical protein
MNQIIVWQSSGVASAGAGVGAGVAAAAGAGAGGEYFNYKVIFYNNQLSTQTHSYHVTVFY